MQASLLISCTITTNVQTNQICLVLFQLIECYPTSVCQVVVKNVQTMAKPLLKQYDKTSKLTNSWLQKHQLNETMHNKQVQYSFMLCCGIYYVYGFHTFLTHTRGTIINVYLEQELQLILITKKPHNTISSIKLRRP